MKGSKKSVGGIIAISALVLVTVAAVVAAVLVVAPLFTRQTTIQNKPVFTQEDEQSLQEKLPVMKQLMQAASSGNTSVSFSTADEASAVELSEAEVNALLSNSAATMSSAALNEAITLADSAVTVKDDTLTLQVLLGDCTGLSGIEAVDSFLTNALIKADFKSVDGKIQILSLNVRGLDQSVIPANILANIPDFGDSASLVDYINTVHGDTLNSVFGYFLMVDDLNSITIEGGKIQISGIFFDGIE